MREFFLSIWCELLYSKVSGLPKGRSLQTPMEIILWIEYSPPQNLA